MKEGQRACPAVTMLEGGPLPPGVAALARRRCEGMLKRGKHAPLLNLLAACYLLGVEDVADALDHEARR